MIAPSVTVKSALETYYAEVQHALHTVFTGKPHTGFHPGHTLPDLDDDMRRFLAPSTIRAAGLGEYRGRRLRLLDLMGNPGARTTKTIASLVMVARAVHHIQQTGERILILTPTSANKGTALRDAVARAIGCGLVPADRLQIVTLSPASSREKLWRSALDEDPRLAARNPVAVYHGPEDSAVKAVAQEFTTAHARHYADRGVNIWYSLDIDNYRVADAVRAFFELDMLPADGGDRLHAHAVSSAYGLLGHHFGRSLRGAPGPAPAYLLVQHLGTPDMVQHLRHGRVDDADLPAYRRDPADGLFHQDTDPRFPGVTFDPQEKLDSTFYTHRPVTSPAMDAVIGAQGGDGIVVSLAECLQRYPDIRHRLGGTGIALPADPRRLREWSLVMALTGVLTAIDRELVTADDIIVHGSGSYSTADFTRLPDDRQTPVTDATGLHRLIERAAFGAPANEPGRVLITADAGR